MKWIDVDDKKPRALVDILFTDGKAVYFGTMEHWEFGEEPCFVNEIKGRRQDCFPDGITHWMPLPKPPE